MGRVRGFGKESIPSNIESNIDLAGTAMTWWRRGRGVWAGEAGAEVVGNVLHFPRGVQHVGAAETERCMAHVFVLVPLC